LKELLGMGKGTDLTGAWNGLFGENSMNKFLDDAGINWGGNLDPSWNGGSGFDFNSGEALDALKIDWTDDLTDFLDFGLADGGFVAGYADGGEATPQSGIRLSPEQQEKAKALESLFRDPRGRKLLAMQATMNKEKYSKFGADDWRKDTQRFLKETKAPKAEFDFLESALLGNADEDRSRKNLAINDTNLKNYLSSLPPGAVKKYQEVMAKDMKGNKFNQIMDRVMPMIPGAVLGMGVGGALGLLSPSMAGATGFGAAGAGGGFAGTAFQGVGNAVLRGMLNQGLSSATSMARGGLADGGRVHRPGDPIIGTKGPVKEGSGGGGMSDEAIAEALRKLQTKRAPTGQGSISAGGDGVSMQTKRALKELDNYAEGGKVEGTVLDMMSDPHGISDTITAQLSAGEYVVPKDVVDVLGVDFFDHIKDRYHTPAAMQEAMGVPWKPSA
jgi:hypothetical protein